MSDRTEHVARATWQHVPSMPPPGSKQSYYDRPAIKEPVWKWMIPAYFVTGGAAGAAAVLGALVQALGGDQMRGLVKRCRWISAAGTTIGTGFLIADLGRPERFLNMLRVFRPASPMNVGSFILSPATGATVASAVLADAPGALGVLGDVSGAAAGVLGMPLAGYTAVLVSNSAIPAWSETRRTLPALFVASAMNAASSLLELTELTAAEETVVRRYGIAGMIGELAASAAVERDAARVDRVALPFREGVSGALWKASRACTAAALIVSLVPGRSRWKRRLAAALGLAGSAGTKFAVWRAGFASARDPGATFELQRRISALP